MRRHLMCGVWAGLFGLCVWNAHAALPPLRIMPLGDSITHGTPVAGGYRLPLYQKLTAVGYAVDYIGTRTDNPSPDLPDSDHQGIGGWRVTNSDSGLLERISTWTWLDALDDPDVILVHIGTNDSGDGDFNTRINDLDALVGELVRQRPYAHVIVSTLLQRTDNADRNNAILTLYNPFIEALVQSYQTKGARVHYLDMAALLDPATDLADGLHPNATGYAKMAEGWFGVIRSIFSPLGDEYPPAVSRVTSVNTPDKIRVTFSKPISPSLPGSAKWTLSDPSVTVTKTDLSDDMRTVTLTVSSALTAGTAYTLTVDGTISDQTDNVHTLNGFSAAFTPYLDGYAANVPASECSAYQRVYAADIATNPNLNSTDRLAAFYSLDGGKDFPMGFDRVAYYLELQSANGTFRYVWVSMDAFTDDASKIGVPTFPSGIQWKQRVSNLSVFCNVEGVATGSGIQGAIEFWPYNYNANAEMDVGATEGAYDIDDHISSGGNYGSMQIHNLDTKKTIFAFNHFHGGLACLGIGNCVSFHPDRLGYDWTFAQNAEGFTVRHLEVLVRPVADTLPPTVVSAKAGSAGTQLFVTFSERIDRARLGAANFSSAAFTVLDFHLMEDGKTVCLDTTPFNLADGVTLSVSGVRDQAGNMMEPAYWVPETYGFPEQLLADVGAENLEGYELVYAVDVPVQGNFNTGSRPYWLDQSANTGAIDRVAYYLELKDYGGNRNWVFTSFETPTQSRRLLGVPTAEKAEFFQQKVYNAFVKSNSGTLNLGSVPEGCSIEFWPGNYNNSDDESGMPNRTDVYDVWDRVTYFPNQAGHGSMQVHNYAQGLTLWAINNFGEDGNVLSVGLGNSNQRGDSTDWTFSSNAAGYFSRTLYVLVRPAVAKEPEPAGMEQLATSLMAEMTAKLGEEVTEGYRLIAAATQVPTACYIRDDAWAKANFYVVDRRDAVAPGSFDRVAYFIQYQDTDDSEPKYIWTAMDPFTQSPRCLCVPNGGYTFQKKVSNLDVLSNVSGIETGTGIETGCIEFWASNYGAGTYTSEWEGSGSNYDWNDNNFNTGFGHGSMQVHNYAAGQVLWAFNNFNKNKASDAPCLGIGNCPYNATAPDWTFTSRVSGYTNVRICILVRENPVERMLREEIVAHVGEGVIDGYQMFFAITNFPAPCYLQDPWRWPSIFSIDNRFKYGDGSVARVAYYMEVKYPDEFASRYVLVAMDPFSEKVYQLGIPIGGYAFQKQVSNMDVYSNDPHITSGRGIESGCVEFWASNYGRGLGTSEWGGNPNTYDWNDNDFNTGRGGHGSMQIHNFGANEVLLSLADFNHGNPAKMGVGTNQRITNNDIDYTFTTDPYEFVRFCALILPKAEVFSENRVAPMATQVICSSDWTRLAVVFDSDISELLPADMELTIDNGGVAVKGVTRYDARHLILSVDKLLPGREYELFYSGVPGPGGLAEDGVIIFSTLTQEQVARPACLAGVAEVADYRLVYRADLPTISSQMTAGTPYTVDEEFFFNGAYDRIGYCLELEESGVTKWVWVSMDAFTFDIRLIGVPDIPRAVMFQQRVSNMNIRASANADVVTGDNIATGSIEFWPSGYAKGGTLGVGGDNDKFDFDDSGASSGSGYGSMQVHNYGASQTVFAINRFGEKSNNQLCLGIGNNPDSSHEGRDWTHVSNAESFTVRNLYVYVRESAAVGNGPVIYIEPEDTVCRQNESFTLSVKAGGARAYQWYWNGEPLAGEIGSTLTRTGVRPPDSGIYRVVVLGAKGATASRDVTVTVNPLGSVMILH